MRTIALVASALLASASAHPIASAAEAPVAIPLPEHPRPDFETPDWLNLNGTWRFRFDPGDAGLAAGWANSDEPFERRITVPFPWGAPLSGLEDGADVGWYEREIEVPAGWEGRRVFLKVGASDWHTTAWLDGELLGEHEGGYTPFSFELTPHLRPGASQRLVLRVDDAPREFRLDGKQGYGNARGVWQTVWLEARGAAVLTRLHFTPDLGAPKVTVRATLAEPAPGGLSLGLSFRTGGLPAVERAFATGASELVFDLPVPEPRPWSLDDPFLYEVEARLAAPGAAPDVVASYFGMREISVVDLPGTEIPWIALNGEPVYLQLALDQAYHPEGYYSFPSDRFVRDEVLRARQIGLNGLRVHVKVPLPRKLYWADRLGMLIMADVPNSWGQPSEPMRREVERTLDEMIARDYNHPSIFAWVPFNETWGLYTPIEEPGDDERRRVYAKETQEWVVSVVERARSLDDTRLVEDNSVCCGIGHTVTDINSWHAYLPGWAWDEHLAEISDGTHPGSRWNFEEGYTQARQPNINSEFGNVWGYEGSTGDVDWSWDYHLAVNAFRRHPKIAGWLYTEHHDVINEWNGYWRYDRSEKETGLGELVDGMSLRDLHGPLYVAVGERGELCRSVAPGEIVEVPLWASFLSAGRGLGESLRLRAQLRGWDDLGRERSWWSDEREVAFRPWLNGPLAPLTVPMPAEAAVAVLGIELSDAAGTVLHRNFTTYAVEAEPAAEITLESGARAHVVRFEPASAVEAEWSLGHRDVLDGAKLSGSGFGHFTWRVPWPSGLSLAELASAHLLVEASSRPLLGKDRESEGIQGDFMRGAGTHDPALNPNAYPMTDEEPSASAVVLHVNGVLSERRELADDPADHRGVLSWHAQLRDRRLRDAGSYGARLSFPIPPEALARAADRGELELRLSVGEELPGGLAVYGRRFGRYPMDPSLVFVRR